MTDCKKLIPYKEIKEETIARLLLWKQRSNERKEQK